MQMEQLQGLHGAPVYDGAGDQIGKVEEIFVDTDSQNPEWIGLGTGFFGTKRVLVPIQGVQPEGDGIAVAYEKEHDKAAEAKEQLPAQVDHEQHQNLLGRFGVDPQNLLSRLG